MADRDHTIPAFHPDIALLAAEAELPPLYKRCKRAKTDEEVSEITDQIIAVEKRIAAAIALTAEGMMVQLRLLKFLAEEFMWDERESDLVDNAIAGLERLAV